MQNVGKDGEVILGFSVPMLVPDIAEEINEADGVEYDSSIGFQGDPEAGADGGGRRRRLLNMTELDVQRDVINFQLIMKTEE